MKRICMVLVLAVITAAVCGCGSGKQEASTNIVSEFSDIIKTYYIQKDTGAEELAGDMFSGDIYKYLNLKISDCRHRAEQENIQKQNYTVKTKLLERIDRKEARYPEARKIFSAFLKIFWAAPCNQELCMV